MSHADNDNYTWTLLNSWGSGNDTNNTRDKGITADGLFRVCSYGPLSPELLLTVVPYINKVHVRCASIVDVSFSSACRDIIS
jgi:hypothetical protein